MAASNFNSYQESSISCIEHSFAVTPHDTNELPFLTKKGVIATGAGNICGILAGDGTVTLTITVEANKREDYCFKIIKSTNTTATGITGFY